MKELDFNEDRAALVEYVADQIQLAEANDEPAIRYLEFLWDENPDLLMDAQDYLRNLDELLDGGDLWTGC